MSFIELKNSGPTGQRVNHIELALDAILTHEDPDEYKAASYLLRDTNWSAPSISKVFREKGFDEVTPYRVNAYRRALRELGEMA